MKKYAKSTRMESTLDETWGVVNGVGEGIVTDDGPESALVAKIVRYHGIHRQIASRNPNTTYREQLTNSHDGHKHRSVWHASPSLEEIHKQVYA